MGKTTKKGGNHLGDNLALQERPQYFFDQSWGSISWVVSVSWRYSNSTFHDLGKTNSLNTTLHQLHINPQNPKPRRKWCQFPAWLPGKPVISPLSSNFTHENQLVSCLYRKEIPWLGFQNSSFWRKETFLGALVSHQTTFCYSITPTNSPKNFRQASFRTASTALAALCHINHESEFLACCSLSCGEACKVLQFDIQVSIETCLLVLVLQQARASTF